jgi:hypothetical protein
LNRMNEKCFKVQRGHGMNVRKAHYGSGLFIIKKILLHLLSTQYSYISVHILTKSETFVELIIGIMSMSPLPVFFLQGKD